MRGVSIMVAIVIMAIFLVISAPSYVNAESFENYTYILIEGDMEVCITGYTGSGGPISIPATIDGKPVTVIGEESFLDAEITSLVVPDNVRTIEEAAFITAKS